MAQKKTSIEKYNANMKPDSLGRVPGNDSLTGRRMRGHPDLKGFTPLPCIDAELDKKISKKEA